MPFLFLLTFKMIFKIQKSVMFYLNQYQIDYINHGLFYVAFYFPISILYIVRYNDVGKKISPAPLQAIH